MGLRHVVLAAIHDAPRSAYDIARWLKNSREIIWTASNQQIYRDLSLLADQGLATVSHFADKKIYTITVQGRAEIERWLSKRSPARADDDVIVKLLAADLVGPAAISAMIAREISDQQDRRDMLTDRRDVLGGDTTSISTAERVEQWAIRLGILETDARLAWLNDLAADFASTTGHAGRDHTRDITPDPSAG